MTVRIEPHAVPIPGYRLIERLGGGGFGEVWKAEAPGGLFKAIKFVYGDLQATGEDSSRAEQELKALSRVKTVHHPYILSLERFDIVDGQLLIVMELADRTLWDRFKECRALGLPGIPRVELLGYLRETAEALDLMNSQFQLQHLDIKPQNLFLVFNHIKVADFGLVKDLGTKAAATVTGGVTPVYAAPETFDGWLSRYSDQYSLAIVYQELLTGQRPFTGGTMRQLVLQHLQGNPELSPLPLADRPIVARALAKNPEERFPTCLELIEQLTAAGLPPPAPLTVDSLAEIDLAREAVFADDDQPTQAGRKNAPLPRTATGPVADERCRERPHLLPPRPGTSATAGDSFDPAAEASATAVHARRSATAPAAPLAGAEATGVLQPALVIGLGRLGLETLQQLRRRIAGEFGRPDALPRVRLLGLDTDPETLHKAQHGESALRPQETALARLHRPTHYLKKTGGATTEDWLNPKLLYRIPRESNGAGARALGRLAFVDNYRTLCRRLEGELQASVAPDTAVDSDAGADLGLRSHVPLVYVVAGLAGHTGSGMFLDVAYAVRHLLRRQGYGEAAVVGLFFLPPASGPGLRPAALANAYAALTELNHYGRSGASFVARYPGSDSKNRVEMTEAGPPFQRCVVVNLPPVRSALAEPDNRPAATLAADLLFRELATPLGRTLDEQRAAAPPGPTFHSIGITRLAWPRQALLGRAARGLCRRLVERWMSKDAQPVADRARTWAAEQWESLHLRPENVIERLHKRVEELFKQPAERYFDNLLAEVNTVAPVQGSGEVLSLGPLMQLTDRLEKMLGIPEECRPPQQAGEPGSVERFLDKAGARLGDEMEQKLAELAVKQIEDPYFRMAGAEEVLRQLGECVEQALRSQEELVREIQERATSLYQKVHQLLEAPPPPAPVATLSGSLWRVAFLRRTPTPSGPCPADELPKLLRDFAKARYHGLILAQVGRFYVGLRGQVSDQLREVGFCRQRLQEMAGMLTDEDGKTVQPSPSVRERLLLPIGCLSLDDAIEELASGISEDDLVQFDRHVQPMIRQQYRALVQVCMGPSSVVHNLVPHLIQQAERFLAPRAAGASVAEMYLAQHGDDEKALAAGLRILYDRAAPDTVPDVAPDRQLALVAVPDEPNGKELQELLQEHITGIRLLPSARLDEVVFYRELTLSPDELEQAGPAGAEAYRQRGGADPAALHCREDIGEWVPLGLARR